MKKYLFGILAVVMAVGVSAFTTKKPSKPYADMYLYFDAGTCNQKIAPGTSGQFDCRENSLTEAVIKDEVNNWTAGSSTTGDAGGGYILAIKFNEETTEDGPGDGALTKNEATNALWQHYIDQNPDALPANGSTFTVAGSPQSVVVTVYRSSSIR